MKNNKLNLIIYMLIGIVIGLLVAFIVVLVIKGNDKESTNNEEYTERVEYNDPVEYFESVEKSSNESKIKKGFTDIVDFLFYGKEINGKTFSELKDTSKTKLLGIALSIDKKIDDLFPNYKDKISDKYKEIKSKVVEAYVNITTKICDNNQELCIDVKNDFKSLKDTFGLTFDYIKKYGIKGLDKLKEWYEDFRD